VAHLVQEAQEVEQRAIFAILQHELQLAVSTVTHAVHRYHVWVQLEGHRDLHLAQQGLHRPGRGHFDCDGLPVILALPHLAEEPAVDVAVLFDASQLAHRGAKRQHRERREGEAGKKSTTHAGPVVMSAGLYNTCLVRLLLEARCVGRASLRRCLDA
jgi:hypothetical protein